MKSNSQDREIYIRDEELRQQEMLLREAADRKKNTAPLNLKWANKQAGSGSSVKSLLQIQAEEEKQLKVTTIFAFSVKMCWLILALVLIIVLFNIYNCTVSS